MSRLANSWRFHAASRQQCTTLFLLTFFASLCRSEDCQGLGFGAGPLCTDCDKLHEFVKDTGLLKECKACCQDDQSGAGSQQFESATLEVCKLRLREFPQVEGFVENQLQSYSNVKTSFKWSAPPRLVLKSSSRQKESIRIDSWTTDNIAEFLDRKLIKSPLS